MNFKLMSIYTKKQYASKKVMGRYEGKLIAEFRNCVLASFDENKMDRTENGLLILDEKGVKIIVRLIDTRFIGVYADVMRFVGYLEIDYLKFKSGTKVEINVFN